MVKYKFLGKIYFVDYPSMKEFSLSYLKTLIFFLLCFNATFKVFGQSLFPNLEENISRNQMLGTENLPNSFLLKPLGFLTNTQFFGNLDSIKIAAPLVLKILPLFSTTQFNPKGPCGSGSFGMIYNSSFQPYPGGIFVKWKFVALQMQPELVVAQNKSYQGYYNDFGERIDNDRFFSLNLGDSSARFGTSIYKSLW